MADDPTRPDGAPNRTRLPRAVKATTTLIVAGPTAVTAGLLSSDDGEFHTITAASPDGVARVLLASGLHDLTRVLHAALAVLPDDAA